MDDYIRNIPKIMKMVNVLIALTSFQTTLTKMKDGSQGWIWDLSTES